MVGTLGVADFRPDAPEAAGRHHSPLGYTPLWYAPHARRTSPLEVTVAVTEGLRNTTHARRYNLPSMEAVG